MIIFETERLIVRQYTSDDKLNFFLINGDEEVVRYIRPPKTREESDLFLVEVMQYYKDYPAYGRWAVDEKETGEFVGSFAIIPIQQTTEMQLGYALLKHTWGRGYATELTQAGLFYTFSRTELSHIYAITEEANIDSQKVLEKTRFRKQSKYLEGGKTLIRFVINKG